MSKMHTIDVDQLASVTGGNGGFFQRTGGAVGEAAGRWASQYTPPLTRPFVPSIGRSLGEQAGRKVDDAVSSVPRLLGGGS